MTDAFKALFEFVPPFWLAAHVVGIALIVHVARSGGRTS